MSTEVNLQRNANISNFIVESTLINATAALHRAQFALGDMVKTGQLDRQRMHDILHMSARNFNAHNKSDSIVLLFFVDRHGVLFARSDQYPTQPIDFSDRPYFIALRDHPDLPHVISPLARTRTNQDWGFYLAVPLRNQSGEFFGSLVQQLWTQDIGNELLKYVDPHGFETLMVHTPDAQVAFVYSSLHKAPSAAMDIAQTLATTAATQQGTLIWVQSDSNKKFLLGFSLPNFFGLISCVIEPLENIRALAWKESVPLMYFTLLGVVMTSIFFFAMHQLECRLTQALNESLHDQLTQLPNRRALESISPRLLRDSMRSNKPLSALFIDIDHFAEYNDDHGHQCGDDALLAVAQTLARCASRPLDFICRWGGEEFVALLPNTDESAAHDVAHKMLATVRALRLHTQKCTELRISVSIGVATAIVTQRQTHLNLIAAADKAMQQAKSAGRDQCHVFQGG